MFHTVILSLSKYDYIYASPIDTPAFKLQCPGRLRVTVILNKCHNAERCDKTFIVINYLNLIQRNPPTRRRHSCAFTMLRKTGLGVDGCNLWLLVFLNQQTHIPTTETEGITQGCIDFGCLCSIGHVVQRTVRVGGFVVDGGVSGLVLQTKDGS